MSRDRDHRIDTGRARARRPAPPTIDRAQWVREFQRKVLEGLASAKAGRLVDGKKAFERLEALIASAGRKGRDRRER